MPSVVMPIKPATASWDRVESGRLGERQSIYRLRSLRLPYSGMYSGQVMPDKQLGRVVMLC